MKKTLLNSGGQKSICQPDQDKDNAIADTKQELILDGSGKQTNKGFVNLTGRVIGNGNGSIHVTVHNVKNYYLVHGRPDSYPQPLPLPLRVRERYEQSREYSGPKLLIHDLLENANTNGCLLSKSCPSTGSSSSLSTRCNKRAVLCGVTYGKRKFRLKGTVNDVINMKELLVKNFKFPIECIRVLTEEEDDPNLIPTRRIILESLKWLVKDCKPGDSLVFYFSGHGLKQADSNEDETDAFDQTLCPVDFIKEGMITDDEINSTIVWPLKKDVTLHAIVDAGHSGTILDLVFVYTQKKKGVSLSTNTITYGSYAYQKNNSTSQRTWEAKLTCRNCKKEFLVPSNITAYRCYACRGVVSKSISGYEQSREDSGAKLFKHEQMGNANTGSSLSLSRQGNKRAVLCGVTYGKRKFRLKGTINDVINMKDLLVENFKFPTECIRVLTEEEHDPNLIPTKRNILESLKWLVKDCQSGDSLVFYFSGHGLQQPEYYKQDEIDGLDETICPVDFMKEGMITDNELNSTIVSPIKNGVTLHAILDACHSGTTLDLMYVYKQKNSIWNWEDNKPRSKEPISKHTSGGVVICFSSCEDSQMAADTNVFGGKGMNGVMTYLFTKTIREHSGVTYGDLLEKMHDQIGKIHQSKCCNSILKHIFHRKVEQDPLLSSTEIFDVSTTKFTL